MQKFPWFSHMTRDPVEAVARLYHLITDSRFSLPQGFDGADAATRERCLDFAATFIELVDERTLIAILKAKLPELFDLDEAQMQALRRLGAQSDGG